MTEQTGVALIVEERLRQLLVEGHTVEHDDEHYDGELLEAARCYVTSADATYYGPTNVTFSDGYRPNEGVPHGWPWEPEAWKPTGDAIRDLVKAGALIAAEIDRNLRKGERDG